MTDEWKLNYKPKEKLPITDWLKVQGRFRHLLSEENKPLVDSIQGEVDREWEELLVRCREHVAPPPAQPPGAEETECSTR